MDVDYPKRKHVRLKDYDYSQNGMYFLTLCAKDKAPIFSKIVGRGLLDAPEIQLTEAGRCVQDAMIYLAEHDPAIQIEAAVIMPNHVHILLSIQAAKSGASGRPRPTEMRSEICVLLKTVYEPVLCTSALADVLPRPHHPGRQRFFEPLDLY